MKRMNFDERVAMVKGWAENDAHWIVDRDEGRYKWQRIRFDTINNWTISAAQMIRLRSIYMESVDKHLKSLRKNAPRKTIKVSQ